MYSGPVQSIARALIDRLQVVVSLLQDPTCLGTPIPPPWRTGSDKVGLGTRAIKLSSNSYGGWVEAEATRWKSILQR
jgi:hypothetical protein